MTTKINKLLYSFSGVTTTQNIDIDFSDLDFDDGQLLNSLDAGYYVDVEVLSENATNTGSDRRMFGLGVGDNGMGAQVRSIIQSPLQESTFGNVVITATSTGDNNFRIILTLKVGTSTDIRAFVKIMGYSGV